jgi:acyl-CoA thioesterase
MNVERIKELIQENDRLGQLLGVELIDVNEGHAVVQLTVAERHLNAAGVTHGGTIFSLADIALAAASNAYGNVALSTNCSITYFHATQVGERLTATANEVSKSRKLAHYCVPVTSSKGEQVAVLNATVYRTSKPLRG